MCAPELLYFSMTAEGRRYALRVQCERCGVHRTMVSGDADDRRDHYEDVLERVMEMIKCDPDNPQQR